MITYMRDVFHQIAARVALIMGSPVAFILAIAVIALWASTGPGFRYSDTWQLVINTGTTIITFLMVFLIQNSQNRDAKATHLKLDELLKGVKGARTGLVNVEELPDDELERLHQEFRQLHEQYAQEVERRGSAKTKDAAPPAV